MRPDRLYLKAIRASAHAKPSRWEVFGALGIAWGGEIGAFAALVLAGAALALAAHVAVCILVALIAARARGRDGTNAAMIRLLATTLPCFGPFAALAAASLLLPRRRTTAQDDAQLWHAHLFPTLQTDALEEDLHGVRRVASDANGASVVSFKNVLQFGSLEQQEYVIALMSRMPRPNFAPLFQAALSSNQPGVRAQAAAGLSLLETRMSAQTRTLRDGLERVTDALERSETLEQLARHLDTVAGSGLLDGMRTIAIRTEALAIWRELCSLPDATPAMLTALGYELAALKRYDAAIEAMQAAFDAGDPNPKLCDWLCDCLLQTNRIEELQRTLARERPGEQQDGSGRLQAAKFWLEHAA